MRRWRSWRWCWRTSCCRGEYGRRELAFGEGAAHALAFHQEIVERLRGRKRRVAPPHELVAGAAGMLSSELLQPLAAGGCEQGAHRCFVPALQAVGVGETGRIVEVHVLPAEVGGDLIPPSLGREEERRQRALDGPQ